MIQFIFVFPFIYCLIRKYDFVGVIVCGIFNLFLEGIKLVLEMDVWEYRLLLFRYILLIAFGCYMFIGKTKPKTLVAIISIFIGAIWLWLYNYHGYSPVIVGYWSGTCFVSAFWIMPFVWCALKNAKFSEFKCSPLELLGKASYNIFLTQMVFYNIAGIIYYYIGSRILQISILFVVSVVCGLIFYKIESKITKKILGFIKGRNYFETDIKKFMYKITNILTVR